MAMAIAVATLESADPRRRRKKGRVRFGILDSYESANHR
jgi:hypothetical protein